MLGCILLYLTNEAEDCIDVSYHTTQFVSASVCGRLNSAADMGIQRFDMGESRRKASMDSIAPDRGYAMLKRD